MGINPDARYELPNSRKDVVNIYSFVRAHKGDPAITVRHPPRTIDKTNSVVEYNNVRASFRN